jgi:hypothetical protein
MLGKDFVLCRDTREYYPEKKPLGELIAFKPARSGLRLRVAPVGHPSIVVFTGIWQERPVDQESQTKRGRRVSGKRSKKSNGKLDAPRE